MQKEALISFSGISKSYGTKIVLDDLSLTIHKGDIFAVIGRSGSGKSTLMKILLGIEKPDKGKVLFKGKDITEDSFFLRKIAGLTTQENSFYERLTIKENMEYYAILYSVGISGKKLDNHIDGILESVKLEKSKNTLAGKISGGMKRRLDFAISLLHDPELLIMDEPTTGLDPILVKEFWKIIRNTAKAGKTIIVISHIFPEIKENCSSCGILSDGKIKVMQIDERLDLMKEFESQIKGK